MVDFFDLVPRVFHLPTQEGVREVALPTQEETRGVALPTLEGAREVTLPTQEGGRGVSLLDGEMKHFRKEIGISLQMHHLMAKNTSQDKYGHLIPLI